jgi:3-dehydroquinate synthase
MRRTIRVQLADRSYDVHAGVGAISLAGPFIAARGDRPARTAFVVRDTGVLDAVARLLTRSLEQAGLRAVECRITPGEPAKSLETLGALLVEMAAAGIDRSDVVVAIGGGVVGDIAGFAGAVYQRGIGVVQCPTTLLSMVDASVGGKTGVNLEVGGTLRKNFVGAFHQPLAVLADPAVLASLPERVFRCGLAECVKHGLIAGGAGDPGLLDWISANLSGVLAREPGTLAELIARNIAVKAAIVAGDEREEADDAQGGRALLNLGHTFAHAIETLPGLSPDGDPAHAPLQHGEAVSVGLAAAARCSAALGLCEPALPLNVEALLTEIGLPVRLRRMPETGRVIAGMMRDKKAVGGLLRLVLPATGRKAVVIQNPPHEAVRTSIEGIRLPDFVR